jgi:hypothetical protein
VADYAAAVGHSVDSLLSRLGVARLDAAIYVGGAAVLLGFCAAVPSAVRVTLLRRAAGR